MKDSEQSENRYRDEYTSEQRKNWYSNAADAYNRTRPRYPKEIIDRVVELAQVPSDANILELGCGPGIATMAFANLGFSIVCLEPSQEACQLARQNCASYPNVEIVNTTFEEWELESEKFNAVVAATSFHWISPEIRYLKAANALKENGFLILLWNIPLQPQYEVCQILHEVYQTQRTSVRPYENRETHEEDLRRIGQAVIDSGFFRDLVSEQLAYEVTYSIDDYLGLLSTLSAYIALEPQKRNSLFAGLRTALESNWGRSFQISCLSTFHVAQKI
ncbi:class I SAM-dependent methyltransferase [Fischerella sp. PCC 9605]|uniref:class I SAM-dependent methyltransferase n=2 Tax=unclassified Fischerella TaxID=494603 RepID=UPI00047B9A52|nr:class I SAM-dependent methyltransferase [Fischerella sp. PCC 9605]